MGDIHIGMGQREMPEFVPPKPKIKGFIMSIAMKCKVRTQRCFLLLVSPPTLHVDFYKK